MGRGRANPPIAAAPSAEENGVQSFNQAVGKRLRLLRLRARLSQTDLANRLGLTFQQVQKYEKGKNRIPIERLAQLAEVLKVSPSFFFGEDKSKGRNDEAATLIDRPDTMRAIEALRMIDGNKRIALIRLIVSIGTKGHDQEE